MRLTDWIVQRAQRELSSPETTLESIMNTTIDKVQVGQSFVIPSDEDSMTYVRTEEGIVGDDGKGTTTNPIPDSEFVDVELRLTA